MLLNFQESLLKTRRNIFSSSVNLLKKVLHFHNRAGNKSIMWVGASSGFDTALWQIFFNLAFEKLSEEGKEQLLRGNQLCIEVCFGLIGLNKS